MKIISCEDAKAKGLLYYFTGTACKRGHICERTVSNWDCVQCAAQRSSARYGANEEYREKAKARMRGYRIKDPDGFRAKKRNYSARFPENNRCYTANSNKRAMQTGSFGIIRGRDIRAILDLQKFKCTICDVDIKTTFEIDHKLARWKGGPNIPENIQCLCKNCHREKTAGEMREYYATKKIKKSDGAEA